MIKINYFSGFEPIMKLGHTIHFVNRAVAGVILCKPHSYFLN